MRKNRVPTIDLDNLVAAVKETPGMSSLELGRKIGLPHMSSRARQVFLYKQSMKYLAMGDASPIFTQKICGKKLWFIMEYAIKHKLERKPPPPEPSIDESLIVKDEGETLTLRQKFIDDHWILGRPA